MTTHPPTPGPEPREVRAAAERLTSEANEHIQNFGDDTQFARDILLVATAVTDQQARIERLTAAEQDVRRAYRRLLLTLQDIRDRYNHLGIVGWLDIGHDLDLVADLLDAAAPPPGARADG